VPITAAVWVIGCGVGQRAGDAESITFTAPVC